MLRRTLLWASTNRFLARRLPRYAFVRRTTRRFLPGEQLDDALTAVGTMAEEGMRATLTRLGENVSRDADADAVQDHYLQAAEALRTRDLDVEISVKPTQLGMDLSTERTRDRVQAILEAIPAKALLWMDMESLSYVDRTLDIARDLAGDRARLGVCLQAYLRRTPGDVESLSGTGIPIRLVKGAYREPAPVAFPDRAEVDDRFVELVEALFRARRKGRVGRVAVATHDPAMISAATRLADESGLGVEDWELAMLYGIRAQEQRRLAREGYAMRVLVAYGEDWFPWYMRRLAERPANLRFVLRELLVGGSG